MKIGHKIMKIDTMKKTKYDRNEERKKIWEVNHTYPELYTAGAILVLKCKLLY